MVQYVAPLFFFLYIISVFKSTLNKKKQTDLVPHTLTNCLNCVGFTFVLTSRPVLVSVRGGCQNRMWRLFLSPKTVLVLNGTKAIDAFKIDPKSHPANNVCNVKN